MGQFEQGDDAESMLRMAASMMRDMANGWPVNELAQSPDAWRTDVNAWLKRSGFAPLDGSCETCGGLGADPATGEECQPCGGGGESQ